MDTAERIQKAKLELILSRPFFATLIMKLRILEDKGAPTMWTDGKRLGYHPGFVDSLTLQELIGVFAHEVLHIVFQHQLRRNQRDGRIWNMAGDHVINLSLLDSRHLMHKPLWFNHLIFNLCNGTLCPVNPHLNGYLVFKRCGSNPSFM